MVLLVLLLVSFLLLRHRLRLHFDATTFSPRLRALLVYVCLSTTTYQRSLLHRYFALRQRQRPAGPLTIDVQVAAPCYVGPQTVVGGLGRQLDQDIKASLGTAVW